MLLADKTEIYIPKEIIEDSILGYELIMETSPHTYAIKLTLRKLDE